MEFTFPNEAKCAIPIGVKDYGCVDESCDGDKSRENLVFVRHWGESSVGATFFFFFLNWAISIKQGQIWNSYEVSTWNDKRGMFKDIFPLSMQGQQAKRIS